MFAPNTVSWFVEAALFPQLEKQRCMFEAGEAQRGGSSAGSDVLQILNQANLA